MEATQVYTAMGAQAEQSVTAGKTLVVGLGETGASAAAWPAHENMAAVFVDSRDNPPGLERVRELMPAAQIMCGDLPVCVPDDVTDVLVSPA